MRVVVWSEGEVHGHEATGYPEGMPAAIADAVRGIPEAQVEIASIDDADQGVPDERLRQADVLLWWSHMRHEDLLSATVDRVVSAVEHGLGLVALHSAISSPVFRRLVGTTGGFGGWRHGDREVLWTVDPSHPICRGVEFPVVMPQQEMYSEPANLPTPDELVFISSFSGGEVFRSGITYRRGVGRIFYFSPGHEEYPVFLHPGVRGILANATSWAARDRVAGPDARHLQTRELSPGWFEGGA